jgi:hypothetical protein
MSRKLKRTNKWTNNKITNHMKAKAYIPPKSRDVNQGLASIWGGGGKKGRGNKKSKAILVTGRGGL